MGFFIEQNRPQHLSNRVGKRDFRRFFVILLLSNSMTDAMSCMGGLVAVMAVVVVSYLVPGGLYTPTPVTLRQVQWFFCHSRIDRERNHKSPKDRFRLQCLRDLDLCLTGFRSVIYTDPVRLSMKTSTTVARSIDQSFTGCSEGHFFVVSTQRQ